MTEINFVRTASRALAYQHVVVVREARPDAPKKWEWQVFPFGLLNGDRAHGNATTEGGARAAAKKALFAFPVVAAQRKLEATVHWNGEPYGPNKSRANYSGAVRKCGAAEGPSTNHVPDIDCAACRAAVLTTTKETSCDSTSAT